VTSQSFCRVRGLVRRHAVSAAVRNPVLPRFEIEVFHRPPVRSRSRARVLRRRTFRIQRIRIQGRLTRAFVRRTSRLGANRFAPRRDNTVLFLVMGTLMLEKRWNLYVLTAVNLVANDEVLSGQLSQ